MQQNEVHFQNKIIIVLLIIASYCTSCTFGNNININNNNNNKINNNNANTSYIPVVLMHGVAQGKDALDIVVTWVQDAMPGAYVKNMEVGDGTYDSIFMHMDDQVQAYCDAVRADPQLANGFNAIGFSQGTLITRGYIERCNNPPVLNYIAWVGPQDGQFGTPYVNIPWVDELLATVPYDDFVQKTIAPAQYWKDPYNYDKYIEKSTFLADLNNERPVKNETYRENLIALKNWVLVYGTQDTVIVPQQSAWFWFYANNSHTKLIPMQDQGIYTDDWLGLQTLDKSGRLHMYVTNCTHYDHHTPVCKYNFDLHTLPYLL